MEVHNITPDLIADKGLYDETGFALKVLELNQKENYLIAHNISFDLDKFAKTGIDLTMFAYRKFCLWYASVEKWAFTKKYRQFILESNFFKNSTPPSERYPLGNLSYPTNAEVMARFIENNALLADEPHTALEDVLSYELPLLLKLVNCTKKKKW